MYAGRLICPGVSQASAFHLQLHYTFLDNYYLTSKHISTLVVSQSAAQRSKMEKINLLIYSKINILLFCKS